MSCTHCTSNNLNQPSASTPVYKEECTLCFSTWDSPSGLFVCLKCFNGGCEQHAKLHSIKHNHPVAVNIKRTKKPQVQKEDEPPQKITKLAIGVPGGLVAAESEEHFNYDSKPACFHCNSPISNSDLLTQSIQSVLNANTASKQEDMKAWENMIIQCEHTITLTQSSSAPKLEKKSMAHCSDCELSTNLWLCLTCGHLGCGRKNYDGTGGNGHGLSHADQSKHHVVCKLGTISPEGTADIHCYECDELRLDPFLADHLATFGIVLANETKTEKSLTEMELEQNLNLELAKVIEGGSELTRVYGPGYTGLRNLGNTCYMASALQVVLSIPEFQKRYISADHVQTCNELPTKCYHCQMYKLTHGLFSGDYSKKSETDDDDQEGVPPRMLKSLLCKDHVEFSTMKQQDAYEFFQFLNKSVQQKERVTGNDPSKVFDFNMQQVLKCSSCNKVKYSTVKERELSLSMPTAFAKPPLVPVTDEKESDRAKRERESSIPFNACIDNFTSDEELSFVCPNCKGTQAIKHYRIESFPPILAVHMRRFVFEDWVPRKLAVRVEMPDILDLDRAKSSPKVPSSQIMEDSKGNVSTGPVPKEEIVLALMDMGMPRVRCEKAALATGNASADVAMNWLFEHMDDADIDTPIAKPKQESGGNDNIPSDMISQLSDMGFTPAQAKKALKETQLNMDRAVEWLFSHADDPIVDDVPPVQQQQSTDMEIEEGGSKYRLFGFIVHLGSSPHSGHYVAYVRKEGRWVQFNDRKVAESKEPPIGDAYMYFFERI